MRINVYAEEMTTEVEVVSKTVTDDEFGTRVFYGIRMFLESPDVLHHSKDDDDRSAITFWVPWTKRGGTEFTLVDELFRNLMSGLFEAARQDQLDKEE